MLILEDQLEDPVPSNIVPDAILGIQELLTQLLARLEGIPNIGGLLDTSVPFVSVGPCQPLHGSSVGYQMTGSSTVPSIAPSRFFALSIITSVAMSLSERGL